MTRRTRAEFGVNETGNEEQSLPLIEFLGRFHSSGAATSVFFSA